MALTSTTLTNLVNSISALQASLAAINLAALRAAVVAAQAAYQAAAVALAVDPSNQTLQTAKAAKKSDLDDAVQALEDGEEEIEVLNAASAGQEAAAGVERAALRAAHIATAKSALQGRLTSARSAVRAALQDAVALTALGGGEGGAFWQTNLASGMELLIGQDLLLSIKAGRAAAAAIRAGGSA